MPQLAEANVARLRHPPDDPRSREFTASLARVYHEAEQSPGFVWHGAADGGHLLGADPADELLIVNLSVWTTYLALHDYVYRTAHGHFTRRRREWFVPVPAPSTVLWWVPDGERPSVADGLARLAVLRRYGPSPKAFGLRHRYHADGTPDRPWTAATTRRGPS